MKGRNWRTYLADADRLAPLIVVELVMLIASVSLAMVAAKATAPAPDTDPRQITNHYILAFALWSAGYFPAAVLVFAIRTSCQLSLIQRTVGTNELASRIRSIPNENTQGGLDRLVDGLRGTRSKSAQLIREWIDAELTRAVVALRNSCENNFVMLEPDEYPFRLTRFVFLIKGVTVFAVAPLQDSSSYPLGVEEIQYYRELNRRAAQSGAKITRVFIFDQSVSQDLLSEVRAHMAIPNLVVRATTFAALRDRDPEALDSRLLDFALFNELLASTWLRPVFNTGDSALRHALTAQWFLRDHESFDRILKLKDTIENLSSGLCLQTENDLTEFLKANRIDVTKGQSRGK